MSAQAEYDQFFSRIDDDSNVHPEDFRSENTSNSSFDHDGATLHSSDERSTAPSNTSTIMPSATYLSTTTQFDANTGPKGVIADARSFETAKKRSFRQTLYAFTDGASTPFKKFNASRDKSKSPSPEVSADEEEDDFMRTWRQKRLDELGSMKQEIRTRRQSPSKRRYGTLLTVDPLGYLDAIEKVGPETVVVVLIYDDEVNLRSTVLFEEFADSSVAKSITSGKVEDALSGLARKHVTTRFVKLHFLEAEMDEIAAPGILAYKGGDCFANLVSFMSEIPAGRDPNLLTVESVLQRLVLRPSSLDALFPNKSTDIRSWFDSSSSVVLWAVHWRTAHTLQHCVGVLDLRQLADSSGWDDTRNCDHAKEAFSARGEQVAESYRHPSSVQVEACVRSLSS